MTLRGGAMMWHGVTVRGIAEGGPKSFKAWIVEPERAGHENESVRELHREVVHVRDNIDHAYLLSCALVSGGTVRVREHVIDRCRREEARIVWAREAPVWSDRDVRCAGDTD